MVSTGLEADRVVCSASDCVEFDSRFWRMLVLAVVLVVVVLLVAAVIKLRL